MASSTQKTCAAQFRDDIAAQLRGLRAGDVAVSPDRVVLELENSVEGPLRVVAGLNEDRVGRPGWADWLQLRIESDDRITPPLTLAWFDGGIGALEQRVDPDLPLDRRGLNAAADIREGRYGRGDAINLLRADLEAVTGHSAPQSSRALTRADRPTRAVVVERIKAPPPDGVVDAEFEVVTQIGQRGRMSRRSVRGCRRWWSWRTAIAPRASWRPDFAHRAGRALHQPPESHIGPHVRYLAARGGHAEHGAGLGRDGIRRPGRGRHGMPEPVQITLRDLGMLQKDGPHAPSTVRRRLASWSTLHAWRGLKGYLGDAGVPDGADVDLSLLRLRLLEGALIFPGGDGTDLLRTRNHHTVENDFRERADKIGFVGFRLHDLRGTHSTMLLDAGVPVHVVAARIGDDPATLLRIYAKRTRKADTSAASVIAQIATSTLGGTP